MATPWPGYTPPSSGSSQNDGTPPITNYQNTETNWTNQMTTLGADTSQMPPQFYGNWSNQNARHPERFGPPTAPTNVVAGSSGTSGTVKVTWTASTSVPAVGYNVTLNDTTASTTTTLSVAPTATTVNFPGITTTHVVNAVVTAVGDLVTATSTTSGNYTVS